MSSAEVASTEKTIPVAEIFGPTIEGEGPWAGTPTYFLRIGGCDFKCLWCDTDHAVLVEKVRGLPRYTQDQIMQMVGEYTEVHEGPNLLAISGGNPGLYDLTEVVDWWHRSAKGRRVLVETQGSKWQPWFGRVDLLTVSPKPPSSGMVNEGLPDFINAGAESVRWLTSNLAAYFRSKMIFKVVVFDERDYEFAKALHIMWPTIPFYLSTGTAMGGLSGSWVAPAFPRPDWHVDSKPVMQPSLIDDRDTLLLRYRWLAERAMNDPAMADAVVGVQLHCLLWGITTKGV